MFPRDFLSDENVNAQSSYERMPKDFLAEDQSKDYNDILMDYASRVGDILKQQIGQHPLRTPIGLNVASGIMSLAGKNKSQRDLLGFLPQAMTGEQPNVAEKIATSFGQYLPGMSVNSPSFIGRVASQGAIGGALSPEDRIGGMIKGAGTQGVIEGAGLIAKPLESIYNKMFPENLKNYLMQNISGGMSLGQHSRAFASKIKDTYENVKSLLNQRYNNFFDADNIGGKQLYPLIDRLSSGGRLPATGGTRFYRKMPDFNINGAGDEFDSALSLFKSNPSVKNAHSLNSELMSQERQMERGINIARNMGQSVTQQVQDLLRIKSSRQMLQDKMKEVMGGDKFSEYKAITSDWKKNIIPYHADNNLKAIVFGKEKNPTREMYSSIFKNPDEDVMRIVGHLGDNSKNDIAYQIIGRQPKTTSYDELRASIKSANNSGFEDYLSDELKRHGYGSGITDLLNISKIKNLYP